MIVVGAGVIGLTCAVRLLEAGHRVDVVARDLPLETTSSVAAAVWYALLHARRSTSSAGRGRRTTPSPSCATTSRPACVMRTGTELFREPSRRRCGGATRCRPVPDRTARPACPRAMPSGLTMRTPGGRDAGLPPLARRPGRGARRHHHPDEPRPRCPTGDALVVNASGIGARLLGGDPTVVARARPGRARGAGGARPLVARRRGADVRRAACPRHRAGRHGDRGGVEPYPGARRWPRRSSSAAARIEPRLAGARVLRHKVGLRPARPSVRLERVGDVVHCYGHGGCGVTVSWGCADDVVGLVDG